MDDFETVYILRKGCLSVSGLFSLFCVGASKAAGQEVGGVCVTVLCLPTKATLMLASSRS